MTTSTTEMIVTRVDFAGVTLATADGDRRVSWDDLRAAASQASRPIGTNHRGLPDAPNAEHELAASYRRLLDQALRLASRGPWRVEVVTHTGGATYEVRCVNPSGAYDRSPMHADEGCGQPHQRLAEQEAEEIRARLRKTKQLA